MTSVGKRRRELTAQRNRMNGLHERRKRDGLCPDCGEPKGPETLTCGKCAAVDRKRMQRVKVNINGR